MAGSFEISKVRRFPCKTASKNSVTSGCVKEPINGVYLQKDISNYQRVKIKKYLLELGLRRTTEGKKYARSKVLISSGWEGPSMYRIRNLPLYFSPRLLRSSTYLQNKELIFFKFLFLLLHITYLSHSEGSKFSLSKRVSAQIPPLLAQYLSNEAWSFTS